MNPDARYRLSDSLEPGESLIWTGAPRQGLLLRPYDIYVIPFSLLWSGFMVYGVLRSGGPPFFVFWSIPFLLMAFYITVGRFYIDARIRASTAYGLTDRRVIIVSGTAFRTTTSLPLGALAEITLQEGNDGTGTIYFGRPQPLGTWYTGQWPGMSRYRMASFELIPDARRVHSQLLEAQRRAAPRYYFAPEATA
jgi:hypothetical protein